MTLRKIAITTAVTLVTTLGVIGSASAAGGGKETWSRTKPHVNVGTIGHAGHKRRSGHTMVIGGIGKSWRQTKPSARQETELMIMITPRLVRP